MADWDYGLFWKEALNQILDEVGEQEFTRWFTLMDYLGAKENEIRLGVPSAFYRDQIKQRYQELINAKLQYIIGKPIALMLEIVARQREAPSPSPPPSMAQWRPAPVPKDQEALSPPSGKKTRAQQEQLGLFPDPPVVKKAPAFKRHAMLGQQYTFEKYIIGENNSFAANAAMAISRNPGAAYNPFLIYGGVGLGKTHLMQAIGHYIHNHAQGKLIYTSAESFTNEFIQAVRENHTSSFKNKYRFIDLLLIDDIHFFENKWETQEELFYTFNSLYDANKQIVFTCDRPVSELKKITDRLKSRFERGLNVDLQPPNYETRYAILLSKAKDRNIAVSDEVLTLISKKISTNIRDLEAALTKLVAYAELVGKPITLDITQQLLKDAFAAAPREPNMSMSIDKILEIIAAHHKITPSDLKGKKRTKAITQPRQLAMYIIREITQYSTTEIGQAFGGRDYSTVIHSCQKIEERLHSEPNLDTIIQTLVQQIQEEGAKTL
ncbi:MAG: chromosomal replication initiator protein DnaA [Spirochaetaceae bacterium]|jgi:chromosomal replication initiator protein|nr:chromosomal replication initiator protein DnaA [Spirochaetaceae bacterium]